MAGQNPMLASMLAQTPKTISTSVPTSVVSTIMTQLPQERLPKNLEKKLVHTPYTTASTSGSATSSQSFPNILAAQKDIVTSDSRGHVMNSSSAFALENSKNSFMQHIDKLLSETENPLPSQMDLNFSTGNLSVQNSNFLHQIAQNTNQIAGASNVNLLNDVTLVDADTSNSMQMNQSSDPVFAEILEQVYIYMFFFSPCGLRYFCSFYVKLNIRNSRFV